MTDVEVAFDVPGASGQAIDVSAIEEQLATLWRSPQAVGLPADQSVPTRTSVLSLAIFARNQRTLSEVERTVGQLAVHHPSRALIFAVDGARRGFDASLDAQVSAHCHTEPEERVSTCYEQVLIPTPPDALDQLPSLIAPLVLPDLPSFLWWPGTPPLGDRRFDRVVRRVDRLVIDSLEFSRAPANLARMATLCRRIGSDCALSDLNWARLFHWRELTAQFFDVPDYQWALETIGRVVIEYGRQQGSADNPAMALLYLGWLSSRLGWRLAGSERLDDDGWAFRAGMPGDHHLRIELRGARAGRRLRGQLTSVRLDAGDGRRTAQFEVTRLDDPNAVRARAHTAGAVVVDHTVQAPPLSSDALLVDELRALHHDVAYELALEEARHYAEALRQGGTA